MIGILDYGLGNVRAFANIYRHFGITAEIVSDPLRLAEMDRIILPGVGAFDYAMQKLNTSGLRDVLDKRVMQDNIPVMGICVGMQMMAENSEEGREAGLGWIPGTVNHFASMGAVSQPLPHMGWNTIEAEKGAIFEGLVDHEFYFLHSFCMNCRDQANVIARTTYGVRFESAVCRNNIIGVQFHPEKSHSGGTALLRNFAGF